MVFEAPAEAAEAEADPAGSRFSVNDFSGRFLLEPKSQRERDKTILQDFLAVF